MIAIVVILKRGLPTDLSLTQQGACLGQGQENCDVCGIME